MRRPALSRLDFRRSSSDTALGSACVAGDQRDHTQRGRCTPASIFLAAGTDADLTSLASKTGAFAGVAKPVRPEALLDAVASALGQGRTP